MNLDFRTHWVNFPDTPYTNQDAVGNTGQHEILRDTLPQRLLIEGSTKAFKNGKLLTFHSYRAAMVKDIKELFEHCNVVMRMNFKVTQTIEGTSRTRTHTFDIGKGLMIVDNTPMMALTYDPSEPLTEEYSMTMHVCKRIKEFPSLYKILIQILEEFQGNVSIRANISDVVISKLQLPSKSTPTKLATFKQELIRDVIDQLKQEDEVKRRPVLQPAGQWA